MLPVRAKLDRGECGEELPFLDLEALSVQAASQAVCCPGRRTRPNADISLHAATPPPTAVEWFRIKPSLWPFWASFAAFPIAHGCGKRPAWSENPHVLNITVRRIGGQDARVVEGHFLPDGSLAVRGLEDISDTDLGRRILASPEYQMEPAVTRIFLGPHPGRGCDPDHRDRDGCSCEVAH